MQEQAPDFFFCFFLLSRLSDPGSLGTALSGPASRLASAPWPSAAVIPRQLSTAVRSFSDLSNAESRGTWKGWRTFAWMNWLSCGDSDFFFLLLTRRRWGLGERGDKILRWRHSNCTHYDACRRETAWVFPEKCEHEDWATVSGSERIAPYRLDQSRVEAYTPGVFPDVYFYPVPSAAARTAPNGVKERASFCLVFRSLNTTSSHRMFSMGYRRAKSTQGNTNFQKRIFWQTTPRSLPAGLKTIPNLDGSAQVKQIATSKCHTATLPSNLFAPSSWET